MNNMNNMNNMSKLNWAKQRADSLMKSVGFEGVERTEADDTVRDTIAAALQEVADECTGLAVMHNDAAEEIRDRFPREGA